MATDAEVDLSAVLMQIFGDLKTRGAAPHDQYGAGRQFTGIAVCARMQLADVVRHIGTERWNDTLFALSGGNDHIAGFNGARVRAQQIGHRICRVLQRDDVDAAPHRGFYEIGVFLNEANDFPARDKAVGIVGLIFMAGQLDGRVGKLKMERVPALADPALTHPSPLDNHMFESALAEEITHRQAGVASRR